MTDFERETYINMNDAEDKAVLCTYNKTWLNRMDKVCQIRQEFICRKRIDGYGEYLFPKKLVSIKIPKEFSAEKRQLMREKGKRLAELRKKQLEAGKSGNLEDSNDE